MQDGDFIKIDYQMRAGEDKQLIETNSAELAKENGIFDENAYYGDFVAIVGSELFFKPLNDSFRNAEVGKEYEVEIKPEDAFGVRDPKNIHVHNMREFQRQNITPEVGKEVMLNRRRGKIISVTPGRVLVDYNNRYAGKTIYYKYTLKEKIEDVPSKALAVVRIYYPKESQNFSVTSDSTKISMVVSEAAKFDVMWIESKYQIVNDIRKYIRDYDIEIVERYSKTQDQKKEENGPEAATESSTASEAAPAADPNGGESQEAEPDAQKAEDQH